MSDKKGLSLGSKQDYSPSSIEKKWQKVWEKERIYSPNLDQAKSPFYNLMMFPYPSAEGMHVGNMYALTGADVYGRYMRMRGFDVFEPIGLDGFGIHSENYAIKVGNHPEEQSKISEKNFYRQLKSIGNGFDWSRKLETYDPSYYKWTQWLFIQLFKAGLAYRKKAPVNFCPSCKTVLADEQVIQKLKTQNSKLKTTRLTKALAKRASQKSKVEEKIPVCERCETEVIKKDLEQWFFRITKYADRLLANIDKLDWSEKVKIAQRQWIGRSEGALIEFKIQSPIQSGTKFKIEVFTTRPDTLFGATFLVLSPEHPIAASLLRGEFEAPRSHLSKSGTVRYLTKLKRYVDEAREKTDQERLAQEKEKTGVFSGLYAINPVNNEKIPVWIADYAVMGYGTGALFGDAHDERDAAFAKKYGIPLRPTILTGDKEKDERIKRFDECYTGEGVLFDSGEFSGLTSAEAKKKIVVWLEKRGDGKTETTYHLRDWLISRQRYWGPPIPMVYCGTCAKKESSGFTLTKKSSVKKDYLVNLKADSLDGWPDTLGFNVTKQNKNVNSQFKKGLSSQPSRPAEPTPESVYKSDDEFVHENSAGWFTVPEKDLPVKLPFIEDYKPLGTGKAPLANHAEFYKTKCPNCGGEAKRETDVSDTFLDSSWYFLRYLATEFNDVPFPIKNPKSEARNPKQIQNSNIKNSKQFRISDFDIRVFAQRARWLPVDMYIGGAEHSVLHLLYSRFVAMVLKDLGFINFEEPFAKFRAHGLLVKDGAKMSKSKGNVVIPDKYIKKFGADTLRTYLMFMGPFSQGGDFRDTGIEGMHRFVRRVWTLLTKSQISNLKSQISNKKEIGNSKLEIRNSSEQARRVMHKTIKKVTEDISGLRYNTAIAALMEWYNYLSAKCKVQSAKLSLEEAETFLKLMAPFVPHMAEELFQLLRNSKLKTQNSKLQSIHLQPWPTYDAKLLEEEEVTIVVEVNGKVRGNITVDRETAKNEEKVESLARNESKVANHLEGKQIKKFIYIERKVINFAVE